MNAAMNMYQSNRAPTLNRNALVLAHQALVRRVALHLRTRVPNFIDFDELIQVGMLGLLEASESFDENMGIDFEHYAHARVRGAMIDEVRRLSILPRSAVTFNREISAARQSLASQLGRLPSNGELAEFLGKDINEFYHEQGSANGYVVHSFDDVSEEALSLAGSTNSQPDAILEDTQTKELIIKIIEGLPDREKLIISLYYVEELNLKEIGAVLDVGESRVSQILTSTVKKLRAQMNRQ